MGKYISIFFGSLAASLVIYIICESMFHVEGAHVLEKIILGGGTVLVFLFSYLIAQIHYLIDLVKKR